MNTPDATLKIRARRFGCSVAEYLERNSNGLRRCSCCHVWKLKSEFGSARSIYDGLTTRCHTCLRLGKNGKRRFYRHHHKRNTPTYISWRSMISRCNNRNHEGWVFYGGRGVSVCERWMTFPQFESDMGVRPKGKTLDRIDPDGNYEPGNCRWATPKEQAANRKNTRRFWYHGAMRTISEISELSQIPVTTLKNRLKRGWSIERALTEEKRSYAG